MERALEAIAFLAAGDGLDKNLRRHRSKRTSQDRVRHSCKPAECRHSHA